MYVFDLTYMHLLGIRIDNMPDTTCVHVA